MSDVTGMKGLGTDGGSRNCGFGAGKEIQQTECHKSSSNSDIVVSSPLAMTCKVMIPGSRLPRSISERWPLFIPRETARSVWVHPFCFRNAWIRLPNRAKRA